MHASISHTFFYRDYGWTKFLCSGCYRASFWIYGGVWTLPLPVLYGPYVVNRRCSQNWFDKIEAELTPYNLFALEILYVSKPKIILFNLIFLKAVLGKIFSSWEDIRWNILKKSIYVNIFSIRNKVESTIPSSHATSCLFFFRPVVKFNSNLVD